MGAHRPDYGQIVSGSWANFIRAHARVQLLWRRNKISLTSGRPFPVLAVPRRRRGVRQMDSLRTCLSVRDNQRCRLHTKPVRIVSSVFLHLLLSWSYNIMLEMSWACLECCYSCEFAVFSTFALLGYRFILGRPIILIQRESTTLIKKYFAKEKYFKVPDTSQVFQFWSCSFPIPQMFNVITTCSMDNIKML